MDSRVDLRGSRPQNLNDKQYGIGVTAHPDLGAVIRNLRHYNGDEQ